VWGDALHHVEEFLHDGAAADQPAQLHAMGRLTLRGEQGGATGNLLADPGEQLTQPLQVQRLAQIVERPELDGLNRALHRRMRRHQDHLAVGLRFTDGAQDLEPAELRHTQVHERDVCGLAGELRERRPRARVPDHLEARLRRKPLDQGQHPGLVVDHQQPGGRGAHRAATGRLSTSATASLAAFRISSRSRRRWSPGAQSSRRRSVYPRTIAMRFFMACSKSLFRGIRVS
jgi:hypothetical protein